jgi:prevent-host-death family protein
VCIILYIAVHIKGDPMMTVPFTEFRKNASHLLTRVENGEGFLVVRHGRPIAEISPIHQRGERVPSWKRPSVRLVSKGMGLAAAIREERDHEDVL